MEPRYSPRKTVRRYRSQSTSLVETIEDFRISLRSMRPPYQGYHLGLSKVFLKSRVQTGQLLDDKKNVMADQYANMRDRMYDADRQEYHFRITQSDTLHARREILPYEEWTAISADHRYLNEIGRQVHAEDDEEAVVEVQKP